MIHIFDEIDNERKDELKNLAFSALDEYNKQKKIKKWGIQHSINHLITVCLYKINRNSNKFTNLELQYMTLYLITCNDEKFIKICKSFLDKENNRNYDFVKIGECFSISPKLAKLRYKMFLENSKRNQIKKDKKEIENELLSIFGGTTDEKRYIK